MSKPQHVYTLLIRTTPDKLWQALTDPAQTPLYYFGSVVETNLQPGGPFHYRTADGSPMIHGEILEIQPPRRLVTSFKALWDDSMKDDAPSRVTYEIEPVGHLCKLTVLHDRFEAENSTFTGTGQGWPGLLSGLKTWLETGEPLGYAPAVEEARA